MGPTTWVVLKLLLPFPKCHPHPNERNVLLGRGGREDDANTSNYFWISFTLMGGKHEEARTCVSREEGQAGRGEASPECGSPLGGGGDNEAADLAMLREPPKCPPLHSVRKEMKVT